MRFDCQGFGAMRVETDQRLPDVDHDLRTSWTGRDSPGGIEPGLSVPGNVLNVVLLYVKVHLEK